MFLVNSQKDNYMHRSRFKRQIINFSISKMCKFNHCVTY